MSIDEAITVAGNGAPPVEGHWLRTVKRCIFDLAVRENIPMPLHVVWFEFSNEVGSYVGFSGLHGERAFGIATPRLI